MHTFTALKQDLRAASDSVDAAIVNVATTARDGVVNAYRIARQLAYEKRVARRARKILSEMQLTHDALLLLQGCSECDGHGIEDTEGNRYTCYKCHAEPQNGACNFYKNAAR